MTTSEIIFLIFPELNIFCCFPFNMKDDQVVLEEPGTQYEEV
jgi:hypothetical protein